MSNITLVNMVALIEIEGYGVEDYMYFVKWVEGMEHKDVEEMVGLFQ